MTKEELKDKLGDLGIQTDNCFPKSTFPYNGVITVGLYEREMRDDFYFFAKYDKKIYKFPKSLSAIKYDVDGVSGKRMIPLSDCEMIWEDKPYVEKLDTPYPNMTLRQYACIHLRVPDSGLDWLDNLIKDANRGSVISINHEILKPYGTTGNSG